MKKSLVLLAILAATSVAAVDAPSLMNYQGVLRDAAGNPLNGDHDIVFRFFDADTGGDEMLIDRHTLAGGAPVTVSGGMFNVILGSGQIADGSGPGSYLALAEVFRNRSDVWLQIEVEGEVLDPRVQVLASAYAMNSTHLAGRSASEFLDTSTTPQTKFGRVTFDGSATDWGVLAYGGTGGGLFEDANSSGLARVGYGDRGIEGYGDDRGAYFEDSNGSGRASVGYGDSGINAEGYDRGGFFDDSNSSGHAYLAYGDYGLKSYGNTAGGYFRDIDHTGQAWVGVGDIGIDGRGVSAGGYFRDTDTGAYSYLGWGYTGVAGYGQFGGGYFVDSDESGYAYVGKSDHGIEGYGDNAGGYFQDRDSGVYVYAGLANSSVWGNGVKNFVQNHPLEEDKVIVYTAIEGDEVATYTRGSALLRDGEARIELGETFQWVTNPDIGLTAHLTPRGPAADLYVESLSTTTLVVRASSASDVAFDYVVFGLRAGFEGASVVREKDVEAYLPSMAEDQAMLARNPSLESYTALDRFERMESDVSGVELGAIDLSRSQALIASITSYDPEMHAPPAFDAPEIQEDTVSRAGSASLTLEGAEASRTSPASSAAPTVSVVETILGSDPVVRSSADDVSTMLAVSEAVEPGDVLAIDPERPGKMRRAFGIADPGIVGIVSAEVGRTTDSTEEAPVAVAGVIRCKVDAGFGSIRPGDLLTSSPTAGHAMRAMEAIPGTILGKAIEPLDAGTGEIRVLLMLR